MTQSQLQSRNRVLACTYSGIFIREQPTCPLCKTVVETQSFNIMVLGDNDTFDGSRLIYPSQLCPNCGIIFCTQETNQ